MNNEFIEILFEDLVSKDKGFLRGPFGGSLKKEIFVPKGDNTYKVYEQGVVLRKDIRIGDYYIDGEYFDSKMYRFEVCPKDFLVSCSGVNYGAIYQMPEKIEKGIINQALLRIRLNNDLIDDKYFAYFFEHHLVNQIIGKKGDSTIPNFPPVSVLKKLNVRIHSSVQYQKQIAKVLSDLDAKIEVNNKITAALEALAKTIYDYWFVQFDFPDQNGKPYKSSGGKMVYKEALKREIPEGWELKSLDKIATVKAGGDKPKKISQIQTNDCNIPIFSNGVTNDGLYGFTDKAKIEKASITVSARGTIGFSVLRRNPYVPIIRLISITPNNSYMIKFLHERVKLLEFENSGSVQKQLTVPQVSRLKIVVPNEEQLKQYHKITNPFIETIENNKKQNQKLSELRDWLLPMLMNGQVTVGESKEQLGMVAEEGEKYKTT